MLKGRHACCSVDKLIVLFVDPTMIAPLVWKWSFSHRSVDNCILKLLCKACVNDRYDDAHPLLLNRTFVLVFVAFVGSGNLCGGCRDNHAQTS